VIEVVPAGSDDLKWIAEKAHVTIGPTFFAIKAVRDGQIVGMVGYDAWTPNSCTMHVAIEHPIAVRRLKPKAFDIPRCLGRRVALAGVLSNNDRSLRFTQHLGFQRIAQLDDAWQPGVHIVLFRKELT